MSDFHRPAEQIMKQLKIVGLVVTGLPVHAMNYYPSIIPKLFLRLLTLKPILTLFIVVLTGCWTLSLNPLLCWGSPSQSNPDLSADCKKNNGRKWRTDSRVGTLFRRGQTKCLRFGNQVHHIKNDLFEPPPLFREIQKVSQTSDEEMHQVYNMGHRFESSGLST